jgi:hypothetical protein
MFQSFKPTRGISTTCINKKVTSILTRAPFSTMGSESKPAGNWYDAFPAPSHTAPLLPRSVALANLSSPSLLLVDVRRTDFEGGTIRGSLNLPAHSFFMNRAVLYDLCKRAGVKQIAFYCGEWIVFGVSTCYAVFMSMW